MDNIDNIDELINMIDGKMENGVSRLKVGFSEELESGEKKEAYHHGRCDVGSPFARGDAYDVLEDKDNPGCS